MSGFAVYYRRVDGATLANRKLQAVTGDIFVSRAEAKTDAVARNCKPFTPFFFYVVEVGI